MSDTGGRGDGDGDGRGGDSFRTAILFVSGSEGAKEGRKRRKRDEEREGGDSVPVTTSETTFISSSQPKKC
jgi:hypothetical protein